MKPSVQTSATSPIRVDWIEHGAGRLGLCFAPGKHDSSLDGRTVWRRSLTTDVRRLRRTERVDVLVSLLEPAELNLLRIPDLPRRAREAGILLLAHPVPDRCAPGDVDTALEFTRTLAGLARFGASVAIHCRGGLGRAGCLAATCLVVSGTRPETAIAVIRGLRPGTIETFEQERFIREAAR